MSDRVDREGQSTFDSETRMGLNDLGAGCPCCSGVAS